MDKNSVLITGASAGIGASLAAFLAQKGTHVILTARREERLKTVAEKIRKNGGTCDVIAADLSVETERVRLVQSILSLKHSIDVLVNNAGFGWYGFFKDMPWDLASQMAHVNMLAVIHLTRLVLPGMLERGQGHIINVSSIAGGLPNQGIAVYSASKAFIDAFSTALYREYHQNGVNVSAVRLGPIETEFYDRAREMENGSSIPAESFAISTERVNHAILRLIKRPRRVMYVPSWMRISRHIENIFAPLIDRLGPLLLKLRRE